MFKWISIARVLALYLSIATILNPLLSHWSHPLKRSINDDIRRYHLHAFPVLKFLFHLPINSSPQFPVLLDNINDARIRIRLVKILLGKYKSTKNKCSKNFWSQSWTSYIYKNTRKHTFPKIVTAAAWKQVQYKKHPQRKKTNNLIYLLFTVSVWGI